MILIPGLASPRAVWDGVVPELAKTHRVHVVQVNGFAGDDPRANTRAGVIDGVVADIDAYIAKAKLKAPAVVGHSMGGLVGLMLAKAHPGDVSRLMIVDSLPYIGEMFLPGATVAMVEPQAKTMRDRIVASYGKPADAAAAEATANSLAATTDARAKVKDWAMAADPRVVGAGDVRGHDDRPAPRYRRDRAADHRSSTRAPGDDAVPRRLSARRRASPMCRCGCGAFRDARPAGGLRRGADGVSRQIALVREVFRLTTPRAPRSNGGAGGQVMDDTQDVASAFAFTGDWRDYAPIAFTNLLLTIVTLGFYSFWARRADAALPVEPHALHRRSARMDRHRARAVHRLRHRWCSASSCRSARSSSSRRR